MAAASRCGVAITARSLSCAYSESRAQRGQASLHTRWTPISLHCSTVSVDNHRDLTAETRCRPLSNRSNSGKPRLLHRRTHYLG